MAANSSARNVILLTIEEARADCFGFLGHPLRPSPALDAFAQHAVVLENHFTVHGKCVPSRFAMLTGRHPHTDGSRAINHECTIPDQAPNLLRFLKAKGYETAFFGHNHTHENLLTGDNRPGHSAVDYHSYSEGEFAEMLQRSWPTPPQSYFPTNPHPTPCHGTRCLSGPITGFEDENRAAQAVHYLQKVRDRSRPFFLHVNFSNAHPPYKAPEPYYSMFPREAVEPFPLSEPENACLPIRALRECRCAGELDEAGARELLAVYLGMIARADAATGRVLDTLKSENLLADSIVIVTSDHGDFAGQYGLPEKWDTAMQDALLRVPMVLSAPGLELGRRFSGLSDHVDLVPTILELLGYEPESAWGLHGQSLVPALAGAPAKTYVFAGGGHEEAMWQRFNAPVWEEKNGRKFPTVQGKQLTYVKYPASMARTKMVRSADWKLIIRLEGGNELYHLKKDPFEMKNLYGQPGTEAVTTELLQQLVLWCLRTDPDRPFLADVGA